MNLYCPTCGKPRMASPGNVEVNMVSEWPYCTCLPQNTTQPISTFTINPLPMVVSPLSPQQEAEIRRIIREEFDKYLEWAILKGKPDEPTKS